MVQTFRAIADSLGRMPYLAIPQLHVSSPPPQSDVDASALESTTPSKLAIESQAPSYATTCSGDRARTAVSEKISGVMYTAEVYHLQKGPDGKDTARLHERFEYGNPIKVIKSEDDTEKGSSILEAITFYAAPSIGPTEDSGFNNAQQSMAVYASEIQSDNHLSYPRAEASRAEHLEPPLYYSPDKPIKVRAKIGTRIYIRSHAILETLESVIRSRDELRYENGALVVPEPFCVLFHYESELRKLSTRSTSTSIQCLHLKTLLNFLSDQYLGDLSRAREEIDKNACCTFEWTWLLFRPGTVVHSWQNGKVVARVVDAYSLRGLEDIEATAFNARRDLHFVDKLESIELRLYFLEFDGEFMGRRSTSVTLWPFRGSQAIKSLPVYPIEFDETFLANDLIQKGNLYWQTTQHMQTYYSQEDLGMLDTPRLTIQHGSSIDSLTSSSRLIKNLSRQPVTLETVKAYRLSIRSAYERTKFKRVSQSRIPEIVDPTEYLNALTSGTVPDEIAMISALQVYGFILGENRWEALDIDHLQPIQFD
ncbi:MAG: hypothetical protein Q9160_005323 [Pyrenula sp. 1 TL-2023]